MRTLSKEFLKTIHKNPTYSILKSKGKWNTREDMGFYINHCIQVLKDYNISKGERIFYKGRNSIEWFSWNIATNQIGGIFVPTYENQSQNYYNYILKDCSPKLIISEEKIPFQDSIPNISNNIKKEYLNQESNFNDYDISTIIYTSGTTGNPKGVILTNENILSNIDSIYEIYGNEPPMKSLSILPWAHIYGQTCELYYNILKENQIILCLDKKNFIHECRREQPSVLFLVPKILELIYSKVSIFHKKGLKWVTPTLLQQMLGRNIKFIFCGGAPLSFEILSFFQENGIQICQGYGCTETSPMISLNHYSYPREDSSVGYILKGIDVKIINNEICIHGPNLMLGYWNNKEYTDKVFIEENGKKYYKTGDLGYKKDGFLYYTGREHENYKLKNGKFVNIMRVEEQLRKVLPKDINFMVFEKDGENCFISDHKNISIEYLNSNLDKYVAIKYSYMIDTIKFQEFLTPKMSIKRKLLKT